MKGGVAGLRLWGVGTVSSCISRAGAGGGGGLLKGGARLSRKVGSVYIGGRFWKRNDCVAGVALLALNEIMDLRPCIDEPAWCVLRWQRVGTCRLQIRFLLCYEHIVFIVFDC